MEVKSFQLEKQQIEKFSENSCFANKNSSDFTSAISISDGNSPFTILIFDKTEIAANAGQSGSRQTYNFW